MARKKTPNCPWRSSFEKVPGPFHSTASVRVSRSALPFIGRTDINPALAGGLRLRREPHGLLVDLNSLIMAVLQIVNLPLAHQREDACIEIDVLQLLRRCGHLLQVLHG